MMDAYDALKIVRDILRDVARESKEDSEDIVTIGDALEVVANRIEYAVIDAGYPSFD
jgi:3-methyladenine DNA glycosylase AlkD